MAVHLLGPRTTRAVNRDFLGHDYVTDVITFDYRGAGSPSADDEVVVEIFVCPAVAAAREARRRAPDYPREIVRYIVHGMLHAAGGLDATAAERRRMRRRENRVLAALERQFDLATVFPPSTSGGVKKSGRQT